MVASLAERANRTMVGTLDALRFDTITTPLFDEHGRKIDGYKRIYRPDINETLAVMSDKYQLVEHHEVMAPAVEALGQDGWLVKASHIEKLGASAFVELERRDRSVTVVGEQVGERILMRNTYDGTSSLRLSFGAVVLICSNGAVVPGVGFGFNAHHTGDIRERLSSITSRVRKIEAGLGARMVESYAKLDSPVPIGIGKEIIERIVGERKMDRPLQYWTRGIGRNGSLTAWNLYNGITQYLTHDFGGNWGRRERKNAEAFDLLAHYIQHGVLPKEEEKN